MVRICSKIVAFFFFFLLCCSVPLASFVLYSVNEADLSFSPVQIENLLEQLRDKDKQLGSLRERVKSLQTDSSNTDTALSTLEEALSEKVQTERERERERRSERRTY